MNGFLVLGLCQSTDAPLGVFEHRGPAEEFAEDASAADVEAAIERMWGGHAKQFDARPIAIGLVPFENGEPGSLERVKEFPS